MTAKDLPSKAKDAPQERHTQTEEANRLASLASFDDAYKGLLPGNDTKSASVSTPTEVATTAVAAKPKDAKSLSELDATKSPISDRISISSTAPLISPELTRPLATRIGDSSSLIAIEPTKTPLSFTGNPLFDTAKSPIGDIIGDIQENARTKSPLTYLTGPVFDATKTPIKDDADDFTPTLVENFAVTGETANPRKLIDAINPFVGDNQEARNPRQALTDGPHFENGRLTNLTKTGPDGGDSIDITYDAQGRISRISDNSGSRRSELIAGRDFIPGGAMVGPDNSIKILMTDGKHSITLGSDFSRVTKELGDKPDGSADRITHINTREGVDRSITWEPVPGRPGEMRVKELEDRVHTNSGRDLIEKSTRIGDTNNFQLITNYGRNNDRTELRSNLSLQANGDVKFNTIKISRPNDLADLDRTDKMHNVADARKHYVDVAKAAGLFKGETSKIEQYARQFEQRCYTQGHQRRVAAPTDDQIVKTYAYLEKIMTGKGNVSGANRIKLAQDAIREYADPKTYINQDGHPSCAFASAECIVARKNPDDHARVLYEAITFNGVRSKKPIDEHGKTGGTKHKICKLSDEQI